jgi:hypothetical protein
MKTAFVCGIVVGILAGAFFHYVLPIISEDSEA